MVRMPPPTRQDSALAIRRTSARLSPVPIAASRSMTCTFGNFSKRHTHRNTSSSRIASRSPCTSCTTAPPLRSMEGMSIRVESPSNHETTKPRKRETTKTRNQIVRFHEEAKPFFFVRSCFRVWSQPHRDASVVKVALQRPHTRLRVMKDRRGEGGVGAAVREDLDEVVERAGAARRDHRNRYGARNGRCQLAVEAALGPVAIDRRQEALAGAPRFGFACPLDRVAVGRGLAAARVHREPVTVLLRVNGDNDRLAAISLRQRGDELRMRERCRVQADFVGARLHRRCRVGFRPDSTADRKRDEQLARDRANRAGERAPRFERRRDVEDDQLVDPFDVVTTRELRGIAGGSQPFEVDALDDLAVTHVETGDDALREHEQKLEKLSTTEDTVDTVEKTCASCTCTFEPPCPPCPPWWIVSSSELHEVAKDPQPGVTRFLRVKLDAGNLPVLHDGGELLAVLGDGDRVAGHRCHVAVREIHLRAGRDAVHDRCLALDRETIPPHVRNLHMVRLTASAKAMAVRPSFTRRRKPDATDGDRAEPVTSAAQNAKSGD